MEKYLSSIKELVTRAVTNLSSIKAGVEKNEAKSCFQMGMIHLLGINTPMDFQKASCFFWNQSLIDDSTAHQLLGFIAECERNYSSAFELYANTALGKSSSYLTKVIEGRNALIKFLRSLNLSTAINNDISSILADYAKGGVSKMEACIKIAAICEDEQSCIEVAQCLYGVEDYISACQWLKKGKVNDKNPLYASIITKQFNESKESLKKSREVQVIEIDGFSLLDKKDSTDNYTELKNNILNSSHKARQEWAVQARNLVEPIIKELKKQEQEARLAQIAKDEAERKKKKVLTILGLVVASVIFFITVIANTNDLNDSTIINDDGTKEEKNIEEDSSDKTLVYSISKDGFLNIRESPSAESEILDCLYTGGEGAELLNEVGQWYKVKKGSIVGYVNRAFVSKSSVQQHTPKIDDAGYNGYLSERRLTEPDIEGRSAKELEIMRNSIYARYGYKFKREDLFNHFSQYSWYSPTTSDMESIYKMMNDAEKYNIDFIKKYE